MKTIILCGGAGTRLKEETEYNQEYVDGLIYLERTIQHRSVSFKNGTHKYVEEEENEDDDIQQE